MHVGRLLLPLPEAVDDADHRCFPDLAVALHVPDRAGDIAFDVALQTFVERAFGVVLVVQEHVADRAQRIGVVRHLVLERHALLLRCGDLGDRHRPQLLAHGVQGDHHHVVHQRMAVHEQIGVLGFQPAFLELFLEFLHRFDHPRIAPAEQLLALRDVAPEPFEGLFAVVLDVEVADAHRLLEVDQRKDVLRGQLRRVGVPDEQRVDRARVFAHEFHEVEDACVVLGGLHADVVQRGGVAEVVLGGVGVGVEHEPAAVDLLRLGRAVGEEVVEIGIDAEDRLLRRTGDHPHQHLFAFGQVAAVGHRDFEPQVGILEMVENPAPECHVLVAFDIDLHQPLVRIGGQGLGQPFGCHRLREGVEPAQFFAELFCHTHIKIIQTRCGSEFAHGPAELFDKLTGRCDTKDKYFANFAQ